MAAEAFVMIHAGLDCLHYGVILSALHVTVSWRLEDGERVPPFPRLGLLYSSDTCANMTAPSVI